MNCFRATRGAHRISKLGRSMTVWGLLDEVRSKHKRGKQLGCLGQQGSKIQAY